LGLGMIGINWLATLEAVSGFIEPKVGPQFLAMVFMTAMALGGLGGLYPALWAARLKAVDALRHA
jgi:ABC-type lipoprotein release transport system permease subunit